MVEIRWTNFAIQNLNDIADYIEKDSYRYASLVVERLFSTVDVLEQFPLSGRMVPEFQDKSIRELIRINYRIVYKVINKSRIDVITVHHSARLLVELPKYPD